MFAPALPLGARVTSPEATSERTAGDVHARAATTLTSRATVTVRTSGGWSIEPVVSAPVIGQRSEAVRVISERLEGGRYTASLEGLAGRTYQVRVHTPQGAQVMSVTFPATGANADGYTSAAIVLGIR